MKTCALLLLVAGCSLEPIIGADPGLDDETGGGGGGGSAPVERGGTLPIPPVLAPTASDAGGDHYEVAMETGSASLVAGAKTTIWGFDGIWPGPTIVARRGVPALVTQQNDLPEAMTIHNHGHKVAAESDGHPVDLIAPGASKTYEYPNDQRAGTYWYHDHAMDLTGKHVYMGLAGFYIIRDPAEDALGLPAGEADIPLVLQDRTVAGDGALVYDQDGDAFWRGFRGQTVFVNGAAAPTLNVGTRKMRFRVLDGSNARRYRLAVDGGATMTLIGTDGGLRAAPLAIDSLAIAPGERYDVLIDFSAVPVGSTVTMVDLAGDGPDGEDDEDDGRRELDTREPIMTFLVDRSEADASQVPAALADIPPVDPSAATVTRRVTLDVRDGQWVMNGLAYDPNRIDVTTRLGQTEIWEIDNDSGQMHPFHLHLIQFQVIDEDGQPPAPQHEGLKDTIPVEAHQRVRLLVTWEGFTGVYVFHCHKLEHEDHRMMLQLRVDP